MVGKVTQVLSANTRIWLLVAGIALLLLVPSLLLRDMARDTREAEAHVSHTHAVQAAAHLVTFRVRDLEAAALALTIGVDTPGVRGRLRDSAAAIAGDLNTLKQLTRDNPDQQVRIGKLEARIDNRVQLTREIQNARDPRLLIDLARQIPRNYVVRDITDEIIAHEKRLLAARMQRDEATTRRADWLWGITTLLQLVLLGLLGYFWHRSHLQREVTERVARRASERAEAVLHAVREPIALVDAEQTLLMTNPAFATMYGSGENLAGKPLTDIGNGAWSDPGLLQRLRDVLARDRDMWDMEVRQQTADGAHRHMMVNAARMPLPDRDDRVVLMTVSDLTAHKVAEDRVRELNRQLEGKVEQVSEVNRELEAFSYSVSHDLRAPLRHISGFAEKLQRHLGEGIDEKSQHYLDTIASSGKRMAALIDDLLVYSRLGRHAMRLQAVDMQSMVANLRAMLDANRHSDDAGVAPVEWHIQPLPVVIADENMMQQAWQNLLGNAVKYSSKRAQPVVHVEYERLGDGSHHFVVRDNGAGFDMAYASKLFGVFQRMHKASEYPGTGIGLASVRRVVTRHDGRVWAEAQPDVGATFHFTLPSMLDNPSQDRLS